MGAEGPVQKAARESILEGVVRAGLRAARTEWAILVVDEVTVKVLSAACRVSDLMEEGVSVVEDLRKRRQPFPQMPAIYFLSPSEDALAALASDFAGASPLYSEAHVFLSSLAGSHEIALLKSRPFLLQHLHTLREAHAEFLASDSRAFVTGHENALTTLFSPREGDDSRSAAVDSIATRLATALASLHEHPNIRFCSTIAAQQQQGESPRAPAAQIAHSLWDKLSILQRRSGVLPSAPTCDILVLDRSVDVVSPIIHEWTYEALVHDLIELNGNVYKHNVEMEDGKVETKEAVLDETDPVFTDLRHLHFADALVKISEKADDFGQKNSAAKLRRNDSGEQREGKSKPLSTRQMRRVMESLPQYRDAVAKLSVHVSLAEGLNKALKERNLKELGKLEQDVVFGQARGKDVVNEFQREECYGTKLDRLRLLMCYAATHPEKFDSKACMSWASAARLQAEEVEAAVLKLELLGARVRKHSHAGLSSFSFSNRRRNPKQLGRERGAEGEQWELGRFMPQAYDRAKALAEGTLPSDIFPRLGALGSSDGVEEASTESSANTATGASLRTANKASSWSSWAKKGERNQVRGKHSEEASNGENRKRRLVLFIAGGATYSEVRSAYELSSLTGRDVLLGSTSLDTAPTFTSKVARL